MRQYDEIMDMLNDSCITFEDLPIEAINDFGEEVIILVDGYAYYNEYPLSEYNGQPIIELITKQDNGWLRCNRYHPDGNVEESYEHSEIEVEGINK